MVVGDFESISANTTINPVIQVGVYSVQGVIVYKTFVSATIYNAGQQQNVHCQ